MAIKGFTHEIIQPTENLDVYIELFNDEGRYVSSHWHNSIEVIYLTSGTLQLDIGGYKYNLMEDECILINSGVVHSTHSIEGNTSIMLQIPTALLNKYIPNYKNFYFDIYSKTKNVEYLKKLSNLKYILKEMELIEKSPSDAGRLKFTSLVFEFLFELYTNFRTTLGSKQIQHSSSSLSRFEPILEYTKQNYNKPISIQEIANVAHLQPEYFCRKFKQYMGQTFLEYLNEIRLAHIYKDLINTNNPLCDILETHGFTNTKLFYKTFKMKFNCTPKEVRKTMKKDDFK